MPAWCGKGVATAKPLRARRMCLMMFDIHLVPIPAPPDYRCKSKAQNRQLEEAEEDGTRDGRGTSCLAFVWLWMFHG